jgi:hypothetical protein
MVRRFDDSPPTQSPHARFIWYRLLWCRFGTCAAHDRKGWTGVVTVRPHGLVDRVQVGSACVSAAYDRRRGDIGPCAGRRSPLQRGADDTRALADPRTNLGAILRIVPSRAAEGGYAPHPDNPFGGPGEDPAPGSNFGWGEPRRAVRSRCSAWRLRRVGGSNRVVGSQLQSLAR